MLTESNDYLMQLTAAAPADDCQRWEREIKHAESCRLVDPAVMDILGARDTARHDPSISVDDQARTGVEKWIQKAIDIEERQCVAFFCKECLLTRQRIDLQDRLRRLRRNPREEDMKQVEQLRSSLNAEFAMLDALQRSVPDISGSFGMILDKEEPSAFDDLDDENPTFDEESTFDNQSTFELHLPASVGGVVPVESRMLPMPSTCSVAHPPHRVLELTLRSRQALRHLNALRGAIADKSFQYSHVIRVAPRKSVRTRARSAITKLNNVISFHCRAYSKCRSAMENLNADNGFLSTFRVLSKEDVKCSTALLDPNTPGSSTLRLSWIWKTGSAADERSPEALLECV